MKYALDTNIISYILKADPCVFGHFEAAGRCAIPPVAYYEIKRGLLAVNATAKLKAFEKFCSICAIGKMSIEAWNIAAGIYAQRRNSGKTTEDADIFIAAFSIANQYTLVTNNIKHFEGIVGLSLENWTKN